MHSLGVGVVSIDVRGRPLDDCCRQNWRYASVILSMGHVGTWKLPRNLPGLVNGLRAIDIDAIDYLLTKLRFTE